MYAREKIYGIAMAALLMTACSQNETEPKSVPTEEPVAISFSFSALTTENGATTRGDAEDAQLRDTGFGVFATVAGSTFPNLMYNQEVTYTYLADDNYTGDVAQNGYWSYSPTKYWPMTVDGAGNTVPQNVTFCAYAPYVAAGGETGITGVSANNVAPYLDYTLAEDLDETVDLLWTCCVPSARGPIKFDMYHALARVAVNVKLNDANTYKTATTKVLISQITLSTSTAAKTGRLKMDDDNTETISAVTCHYPTWTNQTTGDRTVTIKNENTDSYGIIAEEIRYIDDLPYSWQPEGLKKDGEGKGILANALCSEDRPQAYIYFIPNEAGLTLDCTVKYRLMNSETGYTSPELSTTLADVPVPSKENLGDPLKPLRGNRTYHLNLIINPKVPTP